MTLLKRLRRVADSVVVGIFNSREEENRHLCSARHLFSVGVSEVI
jgi:hypothetical protein